MVFKQPNDLYAVCFTTSPVDSLMYILVTTDLITLQTVCFGLEDSIDVKRLSHFCDDLGTDVSWKGVLFWGVSEVRDLTTENNIHMNTLNVLFHSAHLTNAFIRFRNILMRKCSCLKKR